MVELINMSNKVVSSVKKAWRLNAQQQKRRRKTQKEKPRRKREPKAGMTRAEQNLRSNRKNNRH